MALVKYETIFLFFILFSLSLILFFPVYFLYLFLFSFHFFFFFFFSLLILILVFLLLHYSLPTFFAPHQKTIKKRLKTKHLEDERKYHQISFISFFGWGVDGGHGGCSPDGQVSPRGILPSYTRGPSG